ncbi:hypothetical protein [Spirosoma sordidisoli]|nr:hypothetical protein [Spirosoma sordidisoli]
MAQHRWWLHEQLNVVIQGALVVAHELASAPCVSTPRRSRMECSQ